MTSLSSKILLRLKTFRGGRLQLARKYIFENARLIRKYDSADSNMGFSLNLNSFVHFF